MGRRKTLYDKRREAWARYKSQLRRDTPSVELLIECTFIAAWNAGYQCAKREAKSPKRKAASRG